VSEDAIMAHAIAFLDQHVKGAPEDKALRVKLPGTAAFRRVPPAH